MMKMSHQDWLLESTVEYCGCHWKEISRGLVGTIYVEKRAHAYLSVAIAAMGSASTFQEEGEMITNVARRNVAANY